MRYYEQTGTIEPSDAITRSIAWIESIAAGPLRCRFALECASADLQADHEIVMAAVSQHGCALEYASDEHRSSHDIVLSAVSQDGCALRYASEELRSDHRIVMAAVSQNWEALRSASQDLRSNPEILARTNFGSQPVAAVLRVTLISGRSCTRVIIVRNTRGWAMSRIENVLQACAVDLGLEETLVVENGKFILSHGTTLDSDSLLDLQPGALHEATLVIDPWALCLALVLSHCLRTGGHLEASILVSLQLQPKQARVKLFSLHLWESHEPFSRQRPSWLRHELQDEKKVKFQILAGPTCRGSDYQIRKWAIDNLRTNNSGGLLGWGSRGSQKLIYARISPLCFKCFRGCQPGQDK